ncbi:MAG TPA: GNAT family N-acetyltransferase [Chitinophaga sp.]|uniref:GNAT family N-acetyltransferase n=1 Tax=Chitinophaga sp. TaxID=1869181 RepID=UPI002B8B5149|nr:GNAT family N-acetyltransferase [Chitinophaga sp.]HVI47517.1 GNAT family N-acetyltransferase [Chitinophaga sp.]
MLITDNDTHIGPLEMSLLLDADPLEEKIHTYLQDALVLKLYLDDQLTGISVTGIQNNIAEIYNISITATHQRKGWGQQLITATIEKCRQLRCQTVMIGTGNSSIGQLYLYQKMGFDITGIIPNYFTDNYPEPIIENGIPCRHMIRLQLSL